MSMCLSVISRSWPNSTTVLGMASILGPLIQIKLSVGSRSPTLLRLVVGTSSQSISGPCPGPVSVVLELGLSILVLGNWVLALHGLSKMPSVSVVLGLGLCRLMFGDTVIAQYGPSLMPLGGQSTVSRLFSALLSQFPSLLVRLSLVPRCVCEGSCGNP